MRKAKRDANEPAIVAALEAIGAEVWRGTEFDLFVSFRGKWHALEVKSSAAAARRKDATAQRQAEYRARAERCGCTIHVVTTVDEALKAIGAT